MIGGVNFQIVRHFGSSPCEALVLVGICPPFVIWFDLIDSSLPFRGWDENQDYLQCTGFELFHCDFTSTKKPSEAARGLL